MPYVIGIDIGSSSTKVGLFSPDGTAVASARRAYPTDEPQPGYKEQDPEGWWTAAAGGLREVLAGVPPDSIAAVGSAGHISSFTFIDNSGRILRPAVGFQDQRAVAEVGELYARFSREELAQQLGIDLPPGATWPLPKLLWFRKHEPETLAQTKFLLQAKDFINFRLSGEFACDASSSRGMVDFRAGKVAGHVFDALGLDPGLLPPLYGPGQIVGVVSAAAAAATGLPAGVPVICGWNDLNACVLGSGAVNGGDTFNITGTSDHIGTVAAGHYRNPKLICAPFLNGKNLLYGVTTCGGGSLEWYVRASGRSIEELLALAGAAPAGAESLLFLPCLEGERAPVWDPRASGAFVGLRTGHDERHMVRALLEGVAFGLRQILELVEAGAGASGREVIASGGAARIRLWNQIKADVLGRTIATLANPHAGVLGAAMLAAVAAGWYGALEEAAGKMVRPDECIAPAPGRNACYDPLYEIYSGLYPALRDVFRRLYESRISAGVKGTYV